MQIVYLAPRALHEGLLDRVAENGADGQETMTPPGMGGDCDLAEASRRIGDRKFFVGGFDQSIGFEQGTDKVQASKVFDARIHRFSWDANRLSYDNFTAAVFLFVPASVEELDLSQTGVFLLENLNPLEETQSFLSQEEDVNKHLMLIFSSLDETETIRRYFP